MSKTAQILTGVTTVPATSFVGANTSGAEPMGAIELETN